MSSKNNSDSKLKIKEEEDTSPTTNLLDSESKISQNKKRSENKNPVSIFKILFEFSDIWGSLLIIFSFISSYLYGAFFIFFQFIIGRSINQLAENPTNKNYTQLIQGDIWVYLACALFTFIFAFLRNS